MPVATVALQQPSRFPAYSSSDSLSFKQESVTSSVGCKCCRTVVAAPYTHLGDGAYEATWHFGHWQLINLLWNDQGSRPRPHSGHLPPRKAIRLQVQHSTCNTHGVVTVRVMSGRQRMSCAIHTPSIGHALHAAIEGAKHRLECNSHRSGCADQLLQIVTKSSPITPHNPSCQQYPCCNPVAVHN